MIGYAGYAGHAGHAGDGDFKILGGGKWFIHPRYGDLVDKLMKLIGSAKFYEVLFPTKRSERQKMGNVFAYQMGWDRGMAHVKIAMWDGPSPAVPVPETSNWERLPSISGRTGDRFLLVYRET